MRLFPWQSHKGGRGVVKYQIKKNYIDVQAIKKNRKPSLFLILLKLPEE